MMVLLLVSSHTCPDNNMSPVEENGHSRSPSPVARDNGTPVEDEDVNNGSPEGSESDPAGSPGGASQLRFPAQVIKGIQSQSKRE
ncbi:hypothetical protein L6452_03847 [Arctium lappa]|uniref:Uncharacterized protein n=1 Tax=Arctium lappa TaxID=4217 RepID=A0ACB9FNI2_ARCLA|nr:hypothetical protein L6452_03847 [Arctium lappa]